MSFVNIPSYAWRGPVDTFANLPTQGNTDGDARVVLADDAIYIWDEASQTWVAGGGGSGDVVGPASSTDNAIARYDGTTGKLLQDSVVIVADNGDISGVNDLDIDGTATIGTLNGLLQASSGVISGGGVDSSSIARDGSRPPTANQSWGSFNLTGVNTLTTERIGVGGSENTSTYLFVGNDITAVSGTTQRGVRVSGSLATPTFSSAATSNMFPFQSDIRTEDASYTTAVLAHYNHGLANLGASHTVTREIAFRSAGKAAIGTVGQFAVLSDNTSFTGDHFISQVGTDPSVFGGSVTVSTLSSGSITGTTVTGTSILTGAGSASSPSYSFSSDTNTGIYSSAANTINFSTDGTSRGSISSAGLWTIGNTGSLETHVINGKISIIEDNPGGLTFLEARNTSLTGTGCVFNISVESASGADPKYFIEAIGGTTWQVGQDVSDGGKFKLDTGYSLAATEKFSITPAGKIQLGQSASTEIHNVYGALDITYSFNRNIIYAQGSRPGDETRIQIINNDSSGSAAFSVTNPAAADFNIAVLGDTQTVGDVSPSSVAIQNYGNEWWFISLGSSQPITFADGFNDTDRWFELSSTETRSYVDISVETVGTGLKVAEGSNAKQGVATLVAGTVTVANTSVTANSRIFLTHQNNSGTVGFVTVSARNVGTDFTITSSSATDTSDIAWEIFEPA